MKLYFDPCIPYPTAITCGDPGTLENGHREVVPDVQGRQLGDCGSKVRYWCYSGFELQGSYETTCNSNGRWEPARPSCQPTSEYFIGI